MAHCDCQYPVNSHGLLYSEIGALIAPRVQLLVNADADRGFPMDAFTEMVDKIGEVYRLYKKSDALRTAVAPGGHSDTEPSGCPSIPSSSKSSWAKTRRSRRKVRWRSHYPKR